MLSTGRRRSTNIPPCRCSLLRRKEPCTARSSASPTDRAGRHCPSADVQALKAGCEAVASCGEQPQGGESIRPSRATARPRLSSNFHMRFPCNGPGSSLKGNNQLQWPVNKLVFEYGVLTAFVFHVFLLFVVLRDSPSIILGMILLVPHLFFGGGFVTHTNIMLLVMFGTLLRVSRSTRVGQWWSTSTL